MLRPSLQTHDETIQSGDFMLFAIKSEGVSRRSLSLVMCDCVFSRFTVNRVESLLFSIAKKTIATIDLLLLLLLFDDFCLIDAFVLFDRGF